MEHKLRHSRKRAYTKGKNRGKKQPIRRGTRALPEGSNSLAKRNKSLDIVEEELRRRGNRRSKYSGTRV
jgi:hypothetical protein